MATDNMFSRGIRRVCAWVVHRSGLQTQSTAIVTPLITQPGEETGALIPVFDLTSQVVDDNTQVRSDGSAGDPLHAARYDHGLWRIAWSDGRLGVDPEPQAQLIAAQAALTRQTRIARVEGDLQNATAAANLRGEEHSRAKTDWVNAKGEHDKVVSQQRRDPAGFSRLLGFIYFASAIIILVADLPLSLLVADAGLGIKLPSDTGNAADLRNIYQNLTTAWESIAVALGVAALTIAFKLVVDRLHIRDEDDERPSVRAFRIFLRVGTLVAAAGCTIYAFWIMGRIRAEAMQNNTVDARDQRVLYTVLAILFPVVAAFCLSMGRLCWQNRARLSLAARELKKAWQQYRRAQPPYETAQAEASAIQARLDAMKKQQIDEMFLRELYTHAFDRGWAVPETRLPNASLYDRCEHLMHRALSRIAQFDNA